MMRSHATDGTIKGNISDYTSDSTLGSRGISIDGCTDVSVSGNTMKVREQSLNQEYAPSGRVANGAYALQLEGNGTDLAFANNHFEIIGDGGIACRIKPDGGGTLTNVAFNNETWVANVDTAGTDLGYCCSSKELDAADGTVFDNITMTTNSRYFFFDKDNKGVNVFTNSTITRIGTAEAFPHTRQSTSAVDQSPVPVFEFQDTTYTDAGSKVYFFDNLPLNLSQSIIIRGTQNCTLTFNDTDVPQSGLSITVEDSTATSVLTGTTDVLGQITGKVQYRQKTTTRNTSTTLFNSDNHDVDWGISNQSWTLSDDGTAGFNNAPVFNI